MNRLLAVLRWRQLRWIVCAAVIPALWACGARKLVAPVGGPSQVIKNRFQQSVNRDLDLLFVIDDSVSMEPLQAKMRAQMPTFMNVLSGLPGGLPNLHIAVISTSLGSGIFGNVNGCQPGTIGNLNGAFQHKASCTGLPQDQHFIKSIGGQNNFTGQIADVFNCIADIGAGGCGFEHQFEATRLALQRARDPMDPDNAGFLRPGAYLAVVMLTNEDDCSVPADSMLFDPNQQTLADPLGGLQSYRCNEFGHKCDQPMPHVATGLPMTMTNCVSAEDGRLVTVEGFVGFLRSLKANPNSQILVAALAGPTTPYVVGPHTFTLGTGNMEVQPWAEHSCTQTVAMGAAPEYGDPGIRVKQWLDAFGANGVFQSICAPTFGPAMTRIAEVIGRAIGVQCVPTNIGMKMDGSPNCDVTERTISSTQMAIDKPVPHCGGAITVTPCWRFAVNAQCTMNGQQALEVCYDTGCTPGAKPMTQTDALLSCALDI